MTSYSGKHTEDNWWTGEESQEVLVIGGNPNKVLRNVLVPLFEHFDSSEQGFCNFDTLIHF